MNERRLFHGHPGNLLTRRRAVGLGVAIGAGVMAARATPSPGLAQATPGASPAAPAGYARPELLIDAPALMDRLGAAAATVIALMPPEEFAKGHIPGSVQIDWPALEIIDTADAAIARWQGEMERLLGALGVARDSAVVTYDGETLFATRPWWVLHFLGHEQTQILNGGLAAWQQAGGEIATGTAPAPAAAPAEPFQGAPQPDVLAQLEEVRASLDDPDVAIIDARTPEEYAAGHVPGAVNINFPRNAVAEEPQIFKPQADLLALYAAAGVTPAKRVIPYCSTGVRSSVTYFALRLIGFADVALYTGSWEEWGNHPDTPKTTGSEP